MTAHGLVTGPVIGSDFTIVRCRFATSVAEPRHFHQLSHVIMVLGGRWQDDSDAGGRTLRCGDLLFHPACWAHSHVVDPGTDVVIIELAPQLMDEYCALYGDRHRSIQFSFSVLEGIPEKLAVELQRNDSVTPLLVESLLRQMLALGARAVKDASMATPWLVRVLSYIDAHLSERVSVRDLADIACISESRFAHVFRNAVGYSPGAYIRGCRLRVAARLLRNTELPIHEVANATGFYDQPHFCRVFRASKNMTPMEYRMARRGTAVIDELGVESSTSRESAKQRFSEKSPAKSR